MFTSHQVLNMYQMQFLSTYNNNLIYSKTEE